MRTHNKHSFQEHSSQLLYFPILSRFYDKANQNRIKLSHLPAINYYGPYPRTHRFFRRHN